MSKLKVGDIFTDGGLTYKVIGQDAQGRAISTLCKEEDIEQQAEKQTEEQAPVEVKEEVKEETTSRKKRA